MAERSARVLVIGAGIGARGAAAFLRQSGHDVTIAGADAPGPAGVWLAPNGVRVLESLGEAVRGLGVPMEAPEVWDARGEVVSKGGAGGATAARGMTREALLGALRAAAPGVREIGAVSADHLEATARGMKVRGAAGDEDYDLVVAADGVRSALRARWGKASFREGSQGVVSFCARGAGAARAVRVLGEGMTLVHVPIGGDRRAVVAVTATSALADDRAALRAAAGPAAVPLLDAVIEGTWQKGTLVEGVVEAWSAGAMAFVGGAAHALAPVLGQGPAMALEDARALQVALDRRVSVAEALALYEQMRRERVQLVAEASREQIEAASRKGSMLASFRGLLQRVMPSLSPGQQLDELLTQGNDLDELLAHRPDLAPLDELTRHLLRFLVKVGQVDGRFDEAERAFAIASLREAGHHATARDLAEIEVETRFRSAGELVQPFRERADELRERLLRMGVLMAATSGRITSDERKALRDASTALELPPGTLDRLVGEVLETKP